MWSAIVKRKPTTIKPTAIIVTRVPNPTPITIDASPINKEDTPESWEDFVMTNRNDPNDDSSDIDDDKDEELQILKQTIDINTDDNIKDDDINAFKSFLNLSVGERTLFLYVIIKYLHISSCLNLLKCFLKYSYIFGSELEYHCNYKNRVWLWKYAYQRDFAQYNIFDNIHSKKLRNKNKNKNKINYKETTQYWQNKYMKSYYYQNKFYYKLDIILNKNNNQQNQNFFGFRKRNNNNNNNPQKLIRETLIAHKVVGMNSNSKSSWYSIRKGSILIISKYRINKKNCFSINNLSFINLYNVKNVISLKRYYNRKSKDDKYGIILKLKLSVSNGFRDEYTLNINNDINKPLRGYMYCFGAQQNHLMSLKYILLNPKHYKINKFKFKDKINQNINTYDNALHFIKNGKNRTKSKKKIDNKWGLKYGKIKCIVYENDDDNKWYEVWLIDRILSINKVIKLWEKYNPNKQYDQYGRYIPNSNILSIKLLIKPILEKLVVGVCVF